MKKSTLYKQMISLGLMLFLIGYPVWSQTMPEDMIRQFFRIYEQGYPAAAIDSIYAYGPVSPEEIRISAVVKQSLGHKLRFLGSCTGQLLIEKKEFSDTVLSYSYLVMHENGRLQFVFSFYNTDSVWFFQNFRFRTVRDIVSGNRLQQIPVRVPSRHSIGIHSLNLFNSVNIYGYMLFSSLAYSYQFKPDKFLKCIAGMAYDPGQFSFNPTVRHLSYDESACVPDFASVEHALVVLCGYEQIVFDQNISPFFGAAAGVMVAGYNKHEAYGKSNVFFCSIVQAGMNFENLAFYFRPSVAYIISNTTDIHYQYTYGENSDVEMIGRGKFNSPLFIFELGMKF
ncbi:hypothetical protein JW948_08125 [bacterium]|nr:hypothetical protein [bacterium]